MLVLDTVRVIASFLSLHDLSAMCRVCRAYYDIIQKELLRDANRLHRSARYTWIPEVTRVNMENALAKKCGICEKRFAGKFNGDFFVYAHYECILRQTQARKKKQHTELPYMTSRIGGARVWKEPHPIFPEHNVLNPGTKKWFVRDRTIEKTRQRIKRQSRLARDKKRAVEKRIATLKRHLTCDFDYFKSRAFALRCHFRPEFLTGGYTVKMIRTMYPWAFEKKIKS